MNTAPPSTRFVANLGRRGFQRLHSLEWSARVGRCGDSASASGTRILPFGPLSDQQFHQWLLDKQTIPPVAT